MNQESSESHTRSRPPNRSDFIREIERKSDFPATYALAVLCAGLFLVYLGYLPLHITNIISIVFPVYWTMKYFESKEDYEDKQWMTYWTIWSVFFLMDILMPRLLNKIPLYYFSKLIFLIWLFLPATQGGLYLYKKVFSKVNSPLDLSPVYRMFDRMKTRLNEILDKTLLPDREDEVPRIEREEIEPDERQRKEHLKSPEEIVRDVIEPDKHEQQTTEGSTETNTQHKGEKYMSELDNPEKQQHESRQNIVSDAKINTENIRTGLQNVKDQFAESVHKLQEVNDNISSNVKENIETFKNPLEQDKYYKKPQITTNIKPDYQDTFTKTNDKQPPARPDMYQKKTQ
jgi:hypothetical protein